MLTYIVTAAISAFFVPHYLAVFWEPLGSGPGDVFFGIGLLALLGAAQHQGHRGVGAPQPGPRGRRPRDPSGPRRDRDGARLRPRPAGQPGRPRRGPELGRLRARDRGRHGRLHRDRDDLEHGRGGAGRRTATSPGAPASWSSPWSASTRFLPAIALSAMPVHADRRRRLHDRARHDLRRRPGARDRREPWARLRARRRVTRATSASSPR